MTRTPLPSSLAASLWSQAKTMTREYRDEVFRFIEFHANSELMGGLTERDWIPRAPGLRLKQVFLAKTQGRSEFKHLEMLITAAIIYCIISISCELIQGRIETYYGKGHQR